MELIQGGVCAAKGFQAAGIHCGIRKNQKKKDLALIIEETLEQRYQGVQNEVGVWVTPASIPRIWCAPRRSR